MNLPRFGNDLRLSASARVSKKFSSGNDQLFALQHFWLGCELVLLAFEQKFGRSRLSCRYSCVRNWSKCRSSETLNGSGQGRVYLDVWSLSVDLRLVSAQDRLLWTRYLLILELSYFAGRFHSWKSRFGLGDLLLRQDYLQSSLSISPHFQLSLLQSHLNCWSL